MTWFERLMGFQEESPAQVQKNLVVEGNQLVSKVNGKRYTFGQLEIPSLAELRQRINDDNESTVCLDKQNSTTTIRQQVANVQDLHVLQPNKHAMFQVASQFNLLEMVSPNISPEAGVGIYSRDKTQGPACAIAAGAGTMYRNYFIPLNESTKVGQSKEHQVDCLADLGRELGNDKQWLWKMKNGYCLAKTPGLEEITRRLQTASDQERSYLQGLLRVGIMWDTQVTLQNAAKDQVVSQIYCSALPVAYSMQSPRLWQAFAKFILEAAYEATLCAAILNYNRTGNNKVYLTQLGGGAFGNKPKWIGEAMKRAINMCREYGLEIVVVSYGSLDPRIETMIQELSYDTDSVDKK